MTSPEDRLLYRESNGIGHLVLNAPPRNDMDVSFFKQFSKLRKEVLPGLDVRGMIVYGSGRHFSAGANVDELKAMMSGENGSPDNKFLRDNVENFVFLENLPFPVVAAINGCCFGIGLELALSCHYRLAARRAVFSLPEITFDLMPGCGGTVRLPRLIGRGKAIDMVLTGRTFLADEAKAIGLVDLVVDRKELMETAEILISKCVNLSVERITYSG